MRMRLFPMTAWAPDQDLGATGGNTSGGLEDAAARSGGVEGGVDRDLGAGQQQQGVPRSYQQGGTSQATSQDYDVAEDANTVRPPRQAE